MSRLLYAALVGLVAVQRLAELALARRNRRWLLARGGVEAGSGHYRWMVALHAAFLPACVLEVWLLERPFRPGLGGAMLALLLAAMALRYWAIATLGRRWTTRIVVLPVEPLVRRGPYRWLRHPNYLAVAVELAALPLVHGAWWTAVGFGLANGVLLRVRIGAENRAMIEAAR